MVRWHLLAQSCLSAGLIGTVAFVLALCGEFSEPQSDFGRSLVAVLARLGILLMLYALVLGLLLMLHAVWS